MSDKYYFGDFKYKKVIVFGTGRLAEMVINKLGDPIAYFLDNNERKIGSKLNLIEICTPSKLLEEDKNSIVVLVASMYFPEIKKQLHDFDFEENNHFFDSRMLFVNDYIPDSQLWLTEAKAFNNKVQYYLESKLFNDIHYFLIEYEKLNPLDERVQHVRDNLDYEKLINLNVVSTLNFGASKLEALYEYQKSKIVKQNKELQPFLTKSFKNVHVIWDHMYTKKFYDYIRRIYPKQNHFFILISGLGEFSFFSEEYSNELIRVNMRDFNRYSLNEELLYVIENSEQIYIHYRFDFISDYFNEISLVSQKIYWIVWGADLYSYVNVQLYDSDTIKMLGYQLSRNVIFSDEIILNIKCFVEKVEGLLTVIKGDYEIAKKHFSLKARQISFSYPSVIDFYLLDEILSTEQRIKKEKFTVFLGNSGTPTNNHLSIMNVLKEYIEDIDEIIIPLSYGDQTYINEIKKIGQVMFGEKFTGLYELLPGKEYAEIIKKSDIVFMNHKRQQGVGNILAALYLGKQIFLSESITTYKTFIDQGFKLFSIEKFMNSKNRKLEEFVANNLTDQNRILCKKLYHENIKEMYDEIFI